MHSRGTRFKICGLRTWEDVEAALGVRPDMIGFIFVPGRRRFVAPAEAALFLERAKARGLLGDTVPVGVFLDAERAWIREVLSAVPLLSAVQLHGSETEEEIAFVRGILEETGRRGPVIKAFSVAGRADVEAAKISGADLVLLDAKSPGSGRTFDWTLLEGLERPFLLAGGIGPENAEEAIREARPWGLDASSGLEKNGKKDEALMRAFAEAVKRAEGDAQ